MSTVNPLVSIVTPSFNSGDFLEYAIQSVVQQDYPNIEHIVIDGGSTDSTLELLGSYDHLEWVSEPDRGQADALNKGFARARGAIVGWLNADDTYESTAIAEAVAVLQQQPDVDVVYGSFSFIDEHDDAFYTHTPPPFSPEKLLYGNVLPNASLFFRKSVLDAVGDIRLDLHHVLDWEFVLRIGLDHSVQQVPQRWGSFRITAGTKSVEHPQHFWPEIIPILDHTASARSELHQFRDDALFWANLFGALEFTRADDLSKAGSLLTNAFGHLQQLSTPPTADSIAFALIETATRPWHRGFREHPEARATLDRLAKLLDGYPAGRVWQGYLRLYLGTTQFMHLNWSQSTRFLSQGWGTVRQYGFGPEMRRSVLYGALGTSLVSRLRKLKAGAKASPAMT